MATQRSGDCWESKWGIRCWLDCGWLVLSSSSIVFAFVPDALANREPRRACFLPILLSTFITCAQSYHANYEGVANVLITSSSSSSSACSIPGTLLSHFTPRYFKQNKNYGVLSARRMSKSQWLWVWNIMYYDKISFLFTFSKITLR